MSQNGVKLRGRSAAIATAGAAGVLMEVDIFDQQDLCAYVTVTHHCLLKAVENLMKDLGQDLSKIERKSKGFLEVRQKKLAVWFLFVLK